MDLPLDYDGTSATNDGYQVQFGDAEVGLHLCQKIIISTKKTGGTVIEYN